MNLNLIAYPGPAKTIAEAHIEQRIQVPHVPLKFNSETDGLTVVAVIDDPIMAISRVQDEPTLQLFISIYNKVLKDSLNANWIYKAEDVVDKTDLFIMDLFDKLQLDEQNYKTKTGRDSLRDDVMNKSVFVDQYVPEGNVMEQIVNTKNYNLEESWSLYRTALEKSIIL
jgi:hypothetical protein